jgi:hypothetical protein
MLAAWIVRGQSYFWINARRFGVWLQAQAELRVPLPQLPEADWGESDDGRVWRMDADEARRSCW